LKSEDSRRFLIEWCRGGIGYQKKEEFKVGTHKIAPLTKTIIITKYISQINMYRCGRNGFRTITIFITFAYGIDPKVTFFDALELPFTCQ